MRTFLSTLVFMVFLALVFMIGIAGQAPALTLPAFCLWTPAAMLAGFAFARSGLKLRAPIHQAPPSTQPRQNPAPTTRVQS